MYAAFSASVQIYQGVSVHGDINEGQNMLVDAATNAPTCDSMIAMPPSVTTDVRLGFVESTYDTMLLPGR